MNNYLYIGLRKVEILFFYIIFMTSKERKELRYKRRKNKRDNKNIDRSKRYADVNNCFTFSKVMYYSDKCCKGVKWKKSTQLFRLHQFTNIALTCYNVKNNKYKVNKTFSFVINERGKKRNIDAPHIKDRLIHKVISNEILTPIYSPHLIYNNGASAKDKGFLFTLNKVKSNLRRFYKENSNGYVVLIDYSKFFENCSHDVIHDLHKKYIMNEYTIKLIEDYLFIVKGISLGIEIAQKEASLIPNILDHYLENINTLCIRYMDDTIFFIDDYENATLLLNKYIELADSLNIFINKSKTKIVNIQDYFYYCKWKFRILESNKIIMSSSKKTIFRQRRKLKKMVKKHINKDELDIVYNSFKAYLNMGNNWNKVNALSSIINKC